MPTNLFVEDAESALAAALAERDAERVLVIAQEPYTEGPERLAELLGDRCVGVYAEAVAQVPRAVADAGVARAREVDADWVVGHGGGTAIGLAKAIALDVDVKLAAIPTTFSGSEQTNIWGITPPEGPKETGRDERVQPVIVAYAPGHVAGLRREVAVLSLLNALAHVVDAMFDADPPAGLLDEAQEGAEALVTSLRSLVDGEPSTQDWQTAQRGAAASGGVLDRGAMALHHKLAHTVGGSFDVSHSKGHAVLLPHTTAFNLVARPDVAERLKILGDDPAHGLWKLETALGIPTALKDVGFDAEDIPRAARIALSKQYPNPRELTEANLTTLLQDVVAGRPASNQVRRLVLDDVDGVHTGAAATLEGPPLDEARRIMVLVHGRGGDADSMIDKVRDHVPEDVAILSVQAAARTWYPKGFLEVEANRDWQDSALTVLDAAWAQASHHGEPADIAVVGWSQGACLTLTWLMSRTIDPGVVVAFSGAAVPDLVREAPLSSRVFIGAAAEDPWLTESLVHDSASALSELGADVDLSVTPGDVHEIRSHEKKALTTLLEAR